MESKYLDLLAQKYDCEEKVVTEIINLKAILNLPKGTEHFVSDLHGEYQAFQHVLRNGSGRVKEKIRDIFSGVIYDREIDELAALVYYPEDKLKLIKHDFDAKPALNDWYKETINRMIKLVSYCSSSIPAPNCAKHCLPSLLILQRSCYTKQNKLATRSNITLKSLIRSLNLAKPIS